ncbi:MAG: hypothetical protein HLX51_15240 [Micrococcaceae bacterium]|nr:hypothetical protein [Micrococcaceae bacterium]
MTEALCLITGCTENALTRGLCSYHYEKARWEGNLADVALPKRQSAVERLGDEALELWKSGMPMTHVAQELGTSGPTIRDVLKKMGIENPGRRSARARMLEHSREQADQIGQLDHLDPLEAVLQAWNGPDQDPDVRCAAQEEVRQVMPLLARALDRLTGEAKPD